MAGGALDPVWFHFCVCSVIRVWVSHLVTLFPSPAARRWVWVPEGAGEGDGAGSEGRALGACDQLHLRELLCIKSQTQNTVTSHGRDGRRKEKAFKLPFEQRAGIFILHRAPQIILPAYLKLFYSPTSYKKPRQEDEYLPGNRKLKQKHGGIFVCQWQS